MSETTADGCCPLSWEYFGQSCYFFSKASLPWEEARDWCNGHESHLAILTNDKQWVRKGAGLLLAPPPSRLEPLCVCLRTL